MAIIEYSVLIPLPRDLVYQITQDYAVRFEWDPFLEDLVMLDGADYSPRIGGLVYVRSKMGMSMIVEFVQVNPPSNAAIKMIKGPWFIQKFASSWVFDDINNNQTQVRFR